MSKYKVMVAHFVFFVAIVVDVWAPVDGRAQIVHVVESMTDANPEVRLFGPLAATKQIELGSLTFANTGAPAALEVQIRALRPNTPGDCLGPGTVVDETTWVSVPARATVHLDYPLQPRIPATPTDSGAWCLKAFLPPTPFQTIPTGAEIRVTAVGLVRDRVSGGLLDLATLSASAGTLAPPFDPTRLNYHIQTPASTATTTITATPVDSAASVSVNGVGSPQGVGGTFGPFPLVVGPNNFTIDVTTPSSAPNPYRLTIARAALARLSSLTVSPGVLVPAFNPSVVNYAVNLPSSTLAITVVAVVQHPFSTLTINGQAVSSGQPLTMPLGPPSSSTQITMSVTSSEGSAAIYTIIVNRGIQP